MYVYFEFKFDKEFNLTQLVKSLNITCGLDCSALQYKVLFPKLLAKFFY